MTGPATTSVVPITVSGNTSMTSCAKRQIADGSLAKLYDKWFVQPIPPKNTRVGLPASENTKAAWATPNDKPMEDYAKK